VAAHPPIRQRLNQPTSWIALTISEGKNRQVPDDGRRRLAHLAPGAHRHRTIFTGDPSADAGEWKEVDALDLDKVG
jgi:23S rRNA pseudouridine2457 synthase